MIVRRFASVRKTAILETLGLAEEAGPVRSEQLPSSRRRVRNVAFCYERRLKTGPTLRADGIASRLRSGDSLSRHARVFAQDSLYLFLTTATTSSSTRNSDRKSL